jgi:hypothetical protein
MVGDKEAPKYAFHQFVCCLPKDLTDNCSLLKEYGEEKIDNSALRTLSIRRQKIFF